MAERKRLSLYRGGMGQVVRPGNSRNSALGKEATRLSMESGRFHQKTELFDLSIDSTIRNQTRETLKRASQ
jgi:hypothetical protein